MNPKLIPLALLEAGDEHAIDGITRFQKLVFLAQREELTGSDEPYDYVPEKYGPYSKSLYDDLDALEQKGFIDVEAEETATSEKKVYSLSNDGKELLQKLKERESEQVPDLNVDGITEGLEEIENRYGDEDLWSLLEYVYQRYPEMAKNSKLDIPVPDEPKQTA